MKFTLKDYQSDAVAGLLEHIERAQSDYQALGERSSLSLCATTGAGKTVMSAAVIEALFNGSEEFDFEPDEGAVVVWFSDSPDLNLQTRQRLMDASDKLTWSDLVVIEPPFAQARLEPGKVYFLNTQKLSVTSKLTRGAPTGADSEAVLPAFRPTQPDDQAWTIWDTLNNTIDDPNLTLYLFIDEAHRGFGGRSNKQKAEEQQTIVRRLVGGSGLVSPAPIVVGISATIGKFSSAMTDSAFQGKRKALPAVNVDGTRVQESGLLKDTVVVDFTTEEGVFSHALVRRAAEKLRASTEAWKEYAQAQADAKALVTPLMVLQVPNKPDHDEIGRALDVVADVMPQVDQTAVAHVLGEHSMQNFGRWQVSWIEPQAVQKDTHIRVLIAKEAISTGWDCPRAEVMVSFRAAKDQDHITQILGRMVRNPLARRVPGDERLNSVSCILPNFDRTSAVKVVKQLTGQATDVPGSGKDVVIAGREIGINPDFADSDELWALWRSLPTQILPQRGVRPTSRLLQFATELANDGLRPGAVEEVQELVINALQAYGLAKRSEVSKTREEVLTIRGMSVAGTTGESRRIYSDFTLDADDQAVRIAYKQAYGVLSDVAQAFVDMRRKEAPDDGFTDPERDAMVEVAALALTPVVRELVEKDVDATFDEWEYEYRSHIEAMSDLRRERYREIKAQHPQPQTESLSRPRNRVVAFQELAADGELYGAETLQGHLLADERGIYPITQLNGWERRLAKSFREDEAIEAWYRNPPRSVGDSLCIAYRNEVGNWRGLYPDFLLFERVDGVLKASIVDPHRFDLPDAHPKLKALAGFAASHGHHFHRILSVIEVGNRRWSLNLQDEMIRREVAQWRGGNLENLYTSKGTVDRPELTAPAHSSHSPGARQEELFG